MAKFNVGDRVVVGEIRFNKVWPGCEAVITRILYDKSDFVEARYEAKVEGPMVTPSESDGPTDIGYFDEPFLTLVENAAFQALSDEVKRLRGLGYKISLTVTEPPVEPHSFVL
jgi:hypothetical protein